MVGKMTRKTRMDIADAMDKSATAKPNKTGEPNTPPPIMVKLLMSNNKRSGGHTISSAGSLIDHNKCKG